MRITLLRTLALTDRTLGTLYLPDGWYCHTLELPIRAMTNANANAKMGSPTQQSCGGESGDNRALNVAQATSDSTVWRTRTCIPFGTYALRVTWSPRYKRWMPQVLAVPGYSGIRIHAGNTPADTAGCILVGRRLGYDLTDSIRTRNELIKRLNTHEEITIKIE